jgi:hypothetical protein
MNRARTIVLSALAPLTIAGSLLAFAGGAHAAELTAGGSNSISAHQTGKDAAVYTDPVFGGVRCNETSHPKFDTVGCTFTAGQVMTPGQTGSVGWNSDFANSGHQTGVLTYTINADGTGYSGQAAYPNG